jgi:hypothetical protein
LCQQKAERGKILTNMATATKAAAVTKKEQKRLAKEIGAILPFISQQDRMRLAIQLDCVPRTIDRYLAGDIRKIQFGQRVLDSAKQIIEDSKTPA